MLLTRTTIIRASLALLLACMPIAPGHAKTDTMTIALPAEVIRQSLQDILPLKIDEQSRYVEGDLLLTSISKLVMGENSAVVEGMVMGHDLSIVTQVGNQDLRIKVGNLQLPLICDLNFRFDPGAKTLFVKPRLRGLDSASASDMANSVASMLTLFNGREYPVALTSFKSLNATIGSQEILVDMEPVDIRVSKGQLVVWMVPRLSKTKSR